MSDAYNHWKLDEATPGHGDNTPDSSIVPYIEAFRQEGVVTHSSCSGHVLERDDSGEPKMMKPGFVLFGDAVDVDPMDAYESGVFDSVIQSYDHRGAVTQLTFAGFGKHPEEDGSTLAEAMEWVFDHIGVELPDCHPVESVEGPE